MLSSISRIMRIRVNLETQKQMAKEDACPALQLVDPKSIKTERRRKDKQQSNAVPRSGRVRCLSVCPAALLKSHLPDPWEW